MWIIQEIVPHALESDINNCNLFHSICCMFHFILIYLVILLSRSLLYDRVMSVLAAASVLHHCPIAPHVQSIHIIDHKVFQHFNVPVVILVHGPMDRLLNSHALFVQSTFTVEVETIVPHVQQGPRPLVQQDDRPLANVKLVVLILMSIIQALVLHVHWSVLFSMCTAGCTYSMNVAFSSYTYVCWYVAICMTGVYQLIRIHFHCELFRLPRQHTVQYHSSNLCQLLSRFMDQSHYWTNRMCGMPSKYLRRGQWISMYSMSTWLCDCHNWQHCL